MRDSVVVGGTGRWISSCWEEGEEEGGEVGARSRGAD